MNPLRGDYIKTGGWAGMQPEFYSLPFYDVCDKLILRQRTGGIL